jgi:hypothetical protein
MKLKRELLQATAFVGAMHLKPSVLAGSALQAFKSDHPSSQMPMLKSGWLSRGAHISLRQRMKLPGRMRMAGGAVAESTEASTVYVRSWLEKEVKEALQRAFGDEVTFRF